MSTPFGPQLIGETEKTLNALLRRFLEPAGLSEPQWVTLRLAGQLDDHADADDLISTVADRAHFANADTLVRELNILDLLEGGRVTRAGRDLVASVQARISTETAPIWRDLPDTEVESTTRVLTEIILRARRVLELHG